MAVRVYEEVWEVESEMLHPAASEPFVAHGVATYPRPRLEKSGQRGMVSLNTIVLENEFVRAVVVPDLGGRLLDISDKRAGKVLWPKPKTIVPMASGHGFELPIGLQPGFEPLAPVSSSMFESPTDSGPSGVFVGGLTRRLDWTYGYALKPETAEIIVDVRVHNRTLSVEDVQLTLMLDAEKCRYQCSDSHISGFCDEFGVGFSLSWAEQFLSSAAKAGTRCQLNLTGLREGQILPLASRTWSFTLSPVFGLSGVTGYQSGITVHTDGRDLALVSSRPMKGAKVYVACARGNDLESEVDLGVGEILTASAPESISSVAVRLSPHEPVLVLDPGHPVEGTVDIRPQSPSVAANGISRASRECYRPVTGPKSPENREEALFAAFSTHTEPPSATPGLEAALALYRAQLAMHQNDFAAASEHLDEALLRSGDDQIAWWAKAVVERMTNVQDDERAAILNAQFLAPLDPLLRAEAFLSTPLTEAPGPSPLVKPLADDPNALLDVLGHLVDWGRIQDASRLIDESLKHRDTRLVRYFYAWCLLKFSRMEVEAAEQVRRASAMEADPPFPVRPNECRAVLDLETKFPNDPALKSLADIVRTFALESL